MATKKPPYYELDAETRELLEEALEWAQSTSTLQLDDDAADYVNGVIFDLAGRFGLTIHETLIQTGKDTETGENVTIVRELKPKPKFTVIEGLKSTEDEPIDDK
jgi:hypothetical protein